MQPPPLLTERTPPALALVAIAGPLVLGVICGWLLGVDETSYTVLSVLAILGGIASGYEHIGAGDGAKRGVIGGALFGAAIVATSAVTGAEPEAHLPDPRCCSSSSRRSSALSSAPQAASSGGAARTERQARDLAACDAGYDRASVLRERTRIAAARNPFRRVPESLSGS